jgi:hypothetical protein
MSRNSPLGKMPDAAGKKSGNRKAVKRLNVPVVGKRTHLSSMMAPRTSISLADTETGPGSSMMGYVVVAGLAIAAIYAITHS